MSALRVLAESLSFSKGSKMAAALADKKSSDKQLAEAALKTKPYKENAEFKTAVDAVLEPTEGKKETPTAPKQPSNKYGERRGW